VTRLPPSKLGLWRELARETVADARIFTLDRSMAVSPVDGATRAFHRIESMDWVQILPITADDEAVLVRQYRHGAQRITLEMPGGLIDAGEDPVTAALRECFEETGYRARLAQPLGTVNPNPAVFANRLHSFFATDAELAGVIQNTASEVTEVVLVPVADLEGMLVSGEIDHALVAATLWRYLRFHGQR
jgi:8-oxo-dGTP pyrophosphatase MutT (NUDIX family)